MTPKPAEVIKATRNVAETEFAETMPKTKALKSLLEERLEELNQESDRLVKEAHDVKTARQHILDTLSAIEAGK